MRELTYFVAVSLDGRIAAPNGDPSAFPVTGDHVEALVREWPDALPSGALEAMGVTPPRSTFDCVLMGWNTYALGLSHGVASPYAHLEQYVVTREHREEVVPADVSLVSDPLSVVRRLKQGDGSGIWLCGGGELATALADEIDRLVLKVNPLLLGAGRPVFGGDYHQRTFALERSTSYESGVVINEYHRINEDHRAASA